ncbi:MAG: dockerin type I repeat-containing protein [Bacteroidales bacterium]|nr:dockerin type I repeat-containing protein [Candidatus Sodaliphilus aphodohippi]
MMKKITLITSLMLCAFAAFAAGPADITGKYLDAGVDDNGCNASRCITIAKGSTDGAVTLSGFFGKTTPINGTYDAENGILSIEAKQVIGTDDDGVEIMLCNVVFDAEQSKNTWYSNGNITIQFDENGNATLPENYGTGCLCYNSDGQLAIYNPNKKFHLNGTSTVALYKANGTITNTQVLKNNDTGEWDVVTTTEHPTATIFNEYGNGGFVYGIEGAYWEGFSVDENNNVQFDWVDVDFYNSDYTNARLHLATNTGSIWTAQGLTGTLDMEEGTITTGWWVKLLTPKDNPDGWTRWGYFSSGSVITFGDKTKVIVGDLNGDTFVDIADLNQLINVVLGLDTADPKAADINGDSFVDIADINALINQILGI